MRRFFAAVTIVSFSATLGCSTWRPAPSRDIVREHPQTLEHKKVKFYIGDEVQTLYVRKVEFPYVEGAMATRNSQRAYTTAPTEEASAIRIDLNKVDRMEILDPQSGKTMLLVFVVVLGVIGIAAAISMSGDIGLSMGSN